MNEPAADVALLAPVPLQHLESGLQICDADGFVVFGSDAGIMLSEFRNLVDAEHPADILFYASHTPIKGVPAATFRGRFVDYDEAKGGRAKKEWQQFRPPSTASDGTWMTFYRVTDLRALDAPVALSSLTKRGGKSKLATTFVPLGPLIIDTPF